MAATPDTWGKLKETRYRLEQCWKTDLDWTLFPNSIKEGCVQVGRAMNLPPTAVLSGYIILGSSVLSPAVVKVPSTDWIEPVLIWLTIAMPTGSGKSTLFRHLYSILQEMRSINELSDRDPSWTFDDASFEKMGALMKENSGRLLGFYDEMSAFLTQINLYRGRGLSDSHEMALFLQLYNGHPWRRDTICGEANFVMKSTQLTVGGFTQPGVARSLIEMPANAEKGLSHRFIWLFPNPLFGKFSNLGEVDKDFMKKITTLLARQWKRPRKVGEELFSRVFTISPDSTIFKNYYDEVQELLQSLAGMDELIPGMLSKSRGQVLRVATVFHLLFNIDSEESLSDMVSDEAIKAAVNFVKVAGQQTAYIAGRGTLEEEIEKYKSASENLTDEAASEEESTAKFCLLLPGKTLYLTPLLAMKKFRKRGNKEGAVASFYRLEAEGLGKVIELRGARGTGTHYEFEKASIPSNKEENIELAKKLAKYNISLQQYARVLKQKEIRPSGAKRSLLHEMEEGMPQTKSPRKSPQKTPPKWRTPQK